MAASVSRAARLTIASLFVVPLAMDLSAQQTRVVVSPAPDPAVLPATGTAAITGTVIDAETSRPIAGAIVTLDERRPGSPRRSRAQVTTPKGRFAFVNLPASDMYLLTSAKTGYLDGGFRRLDPRGPVMPIAIADGQWIGDLRVMLARPGSISGTVVDERGEPIVGAYVRVLPQLPIGGRTQWLAGPVARTDDRGVYRIAGLGPGAYVVSVPSVQATLPTDAAVKPPTAMAGTSMADLRAAGEAARGERLVVDAGGGHQLVVGRYTVPPPPAADGRRTAYPIVFYPNAVNPSDATTVQLDISEERQSIDFQLRPIPTARVSGIVQGPPDAIANLHLRLVPVGLEELGQGSEAATTVTRSDGRFMFLDVPGGSYVLDARHTLLELTYTSMPGMATALPAPVPFAARSAAGGSIIAAPPGVGTSSLHDWIEAGYWGQTRVDVSRHDVDDVVLRLRRPATMTGRIEWMPDGKPSAIPIRVVLEPADGRRSLGVLRPTGGPRDDAKTFTIPGLMAGEYLLRVPGGAVVESITWEGRDYTERPFDATDGRDISGVVLTLTTASTSISGIVRDGSSPLTSGAAVMAFPVEPERWSRYGFNPPRLRSVLATLDGRYRVEGLPMGEYYLLAVPASQERAWLDPEFLASHAGRGTRVRLDRRDAQIANLQLSLVR